MAPNNANPNAGKYRADDDPYRVGYLEGVAFQKDREHNLRRLIAEDDPENLHCSIKRETWRKANALWQQRTNCPNAYMSPEQLLQWVTIVVPELLDTIDWTNEAGYVKGYLTGRGIDARTGKEADKFRSKRD